MKYQLTRSAVFCFFITMTGIVSAQTPATDTEPAGKIAPHPLYRDPGFDNSIGPSHNTESKRWLS
jgi:hypothetical protein